MKLDVGQSLGKVSLQALLFPDNDDFALTIGCAIRQEVFELSGCILVDKDDSMGHGLRNGESFNLAVNVQSVVIRSEGIEHIDGLRTKQKLGSQTSTDSHMRAGFHSGALSLSI